MLLGGVSFGWCDNLGVPPPNTSVTISGNGLFRANNYRLRPWHGTHTVDMSGNATMDIGAFWWEATEGSCFRFAGGTIIINGDQTGADGIINQPWFNSPSYSRRPSRRGCRPLPCRFRRSGRKRDWW